MVVNVILVDVPAYHGLVMTSEDSRFKDTYGAFLKTSPRILYSNMCEIYNWCKNTFGEKCEFEVEQ